MECTRSLLPQTWTCHVNPDFPIEFESKMLIELTQISKPEVSALRALYARDSSSIYIYTAHTPAHTLVQADIARQPLAPSAP